MYEQQPAMKTRREFVRSAGVAVCTLAPRLAKASGPHADRIKTHTIESDFQAGKTEIHVLLPDDIENGCRFPVVYVLPVEAGNRSQYGNGLLEVQKQNLHNRYHVICVSPTFSQLPWYADHPSNLAVRQESHFLRVVVPFVEHIYPALTHPAGRLLVGFSKSGWGAFSLLLRHPEVFGRTAAWDAPLNMQRPDRFGMEEIFGTQENFEKYRIISLLEREADALRSRKRMALVGHANFRDHHEAVHALMAKLQIPHEYLDGPQREHTWGSGWLAAAFEAVSSAFSAPSAVQFSSSPMAKHRTNKKQLSHLI